MTNAKIPINGVWKECERRKVPYVEVRPRDKFAKIEIDLCSTNYQLSKKGQRDIIKRLRQYQQSVNNRKPKRVFESRPGMRSIITEVYRRDVGAILQYLQAIIDANKVFVEFTGFT